LTFVVTDGGAPTGVPASSPASAPDASLRINFLAWNDPPAWVPGGLVAVTVPENATAGTTVVGNLRANVTDADAGDAARLRFSIIAGNALGAFAVADALTGSLVVANASALDFETGPRNWTLTLAVTDPSNATANATLVVNVKDVNEPPSVSLRDAAVRIDERTGAIEPPPRGGIVVCDPDAGEAARVAVSVVGFAPANDSTALWELRGGAGGVSGAAATGLFNVTLANPAWLTSTCATFTLAVAPGALATLSGLLNRTLLLGFSASEPLSADPSRPALSSAAPALLAVELIRANLPVSWPNAT
jgi:hypothetical protein